MKKVLIIFLILETVFFSSCSKDNPPPTIIDEPDNVVTESAEIQESGEKDVIEHESEKHPIESSEFLETAETEFTEIATTPIPEKHETTTISTTIAEPETSVPPLTLKPEVKEYFYPDYLTFGSEATIYTKGIDYNVRTATFSFDPRDPNLNLVKRSPDCEFFYSKAEWDEFYGKINPNHTWSMYTTPLSAIATKYTEEFFQDNVLIMQHNFRDSGRFYFDKNNCVKKLGCEGDTLKLITNMTFVDNGYKNAFYVNAVLIEVSKENYGNPLKAEFEVIELGDFYQEDEETNTIYRINGGNIEKIPAETFEYLCKFPEFKNFLECRLIFYAGSSIRKDLFKQLYEEYYS